MKRLEHPPIFFWQAPVYETWAHVPERSVVALTFTFLNCYIVVRAPLHTAVDLAQEWAGKGVADVFHIASWKWHSEELLLRLQAMRFWVSKDQDFRKQLWHELDFFKLLENPQVKI